MKPVLGGIPLVVETSGTGFTCASPPRLDTPAPGEEEQPMRRRSGGLWRRTTDDGDMLEMEYARKKLGEERGGWTGAGGLLAALSRPLPTGMPRPSTRHKHTARWTAAPGMIATCTPLPPPQA